MMRDRAGFPGTSRRWRTRTQIGVGYIVAGLGSIWYGAGQEIRPTPTQQEIPFGFVWPLWAVVTGVLLLAGGVLAVWWPRRWRGVPAGGWVSVVGVAVLAAGVTARGVRDIVDRVGGGLPGVWAMFAGLSWVILYGAKNTIERSAAGDR